MEHELQALTELFEKNSIPEIKTAHGFLEIIKKTHRETINSTLYAHFLTCPIETIASTFRDTLYQLIKEKTGKEFQFSFPNVATEVKTPNGGRIDLVIEQSSSQEVILIENKIYHNLHNDLIDYWNYASYPEAKKVGILLTLRSHPIPKEVEGKFINITHHEWINAIQKEIVLQDLPTNYAVYLNDFINTIHNLTYNFHMNAAAQFYFKHAQQVTTACETQRHALEFLNNQYAIIAQKLGWEVYGTDKNWRNFWDEDNTLDTYLTVVTKDLHEGKNMISIIIELNRNDRNHLDELKEKFNNHPQYLSGSEGEHKGSYIHFIVKTYTLSDDELANFAEFVYQKINEDFSDLLVKIIQHIYPDKNINRWISNFKTT